MEKPLKNVRCKIVNRIGRKKNYMFFKRNSQNIKLFYNVLTKNWGFVNCGHNVFLRHPSWHTLGGHCRILEIIDRGHPSPAPPRP